MNELISNQWLFLTTQVFNKTVLQAVHTLQIKALDGLLSFQIRSAFDRSTVFVRLCCYAQILFIFVHSWPLHLTSKPILCLHHHLMSLMLCQSDYLVSQDLGYHYPCIRTKQKLAIMRCVIRV